MVNEATFRCDKCRVLFQATLPDRCLLPRGGKAPNDWDYYAFSFDGKTKGLCPKCGSEHVRPVPLLTQRFAAQNNIGYDRT